MLSKTDKAFLDVAKKLEKKLKRKLPKSKWNSIRGEIDVIFKAKDPDDFNTRRESSSIKAALSSSSVELNDTYRALLVLKQKLKEELKVKHKALGERAGTGTPLDDAKEKFESGTTFLANKIDYLRANYQAASGRDKVIAGAAIVLGLGYFLGSQSKEAVEAKKMFGKAAILLGAYVGIGAIGRTFVGKSPQEMALDWFSTKSDRSKFFKEVFGVKSSFDILSIKNGLVYLGPKDFLQSFERYKDRKDNHYGKMRLDKQVPNDQKTLSLVPPDKMHPRQQWRFFQILDDKYGMEEIMLQIDFLYQSGKLRRKPTVKDVVTALTASKTMLAMKRGKSGKDVIKFKNRPISIDLTKVTPKKKWWESMPGDVDWRVALIPPSDISALVKKKKAKDYMNNKLAHLYIDSHKVLKNVIKNKKYVSGMYKTGFEKANAKRRVHSDNMLVYESPKADYIMSQVAIEYGKYPRNENKARTQAVLDARTQAVAEMAGKHGTAVNGRTLQPVAGFFVGNRSVEASKKLKPGQAVYFTMLLVRRKSDIAKSGVLPNAIELGETDSKELVSGTTPLTGDKMKSLCKKNDSLLGAYEGFLSRFGLSSHTTKDKAAADKILKHYSEKFSGQMSIKTLIIYLAARVTPTEADRVGTSLKIPVSLGYGADIRKSAQIRNMVLASSILTIKQKREMLSTLAPLYALAIDKDYRAAKILTDYMVSASGRVLALISNLTPSRGTFTMISDHDIKFRAYVKNPTDWDDNYKALKKTMKSTR